MPNDSGPTMPAPQPIPLRQLEGAYFRLPLPEGWVDRSFYCAGGPLHNGFQASMTVTYEIRKQLADLRQYVSIQKSQLEGQLTDFELAPGPEQPLAEGPGFRLDFMWKNQEGVPLRQRQWYFYRAPVVWVVTASAHREAFDGMESTFSQTCRQIALK